MTDETPTADWPTLFLQLPMAVQQLEMHDAHCSYEVAVLLRAALGLLNPPMPPERAYDILIDTIGRIASLSDRHCEQLPERMLQFLNRVDDANADYLFGEDMAEEESGWPPAYNAAAFAELRAAKANWASGENETPRLSDEALSLLRSLRRDNFLVAEDVAFHDAAVATLAA